MITQMELLTEGGFVKGLLKGGLNMMKGGYHTTRNFLGTHLPQTVKTPISATLKGVNYAANAAKTGTLKATDFLKLTNAGKLNRKGAFVLGGGTAAVPAGVAIDNLNTDYNNLQQDAGEVLGYMGAQNYGLRNELAKHQNMSRWDHAKAVVTG